MTRFNPRGGGGGTLIFSHICRLRLLGHLYAIYGLFLRSRYKIGIFFGLLKFQIFFRVLEIPDIFLG